MTKPNEDYARFIELAALGDLALTGAQRRNSAEQSYLFDVVREGGTRFDKTTQEVHDDVIACKERMALTWRGRAHIWLRKAMSRVWQLEAHAWGHVFADGLLRTYERDDVTLLDPRRVTELKGVAPKASIVVLSWNRREYLERTLRYFLRTVDYPSYELIVVDNGSTDGSADLLRRMADAGSITKLILSSTNLGVARGYNLGFAYSDPATEYWVKLDSDIMVLSPGWLHEFVRIFRTDERIGLLALNQNNHTMLRVLPTERLAGAKVLNWGYWRAGGACMTIPRRVFQRLGFFSEGYDGLYTPDEGDYYQRMARMGMDGYFVLDLNAYHQSGLDTTTYRRATTRRNESELTAYRESFRPVLTQYDRGDRGLTCFYEKYQAVRFPEGTNVLELAQPE